MERKDQLTGATYSKEWERYVRYHGLTPDWADRVMAQETHVGRDSVFAEALRHLEQDTTLG